MTKLYNHLFSIAFTIVDPSPTGENLHPATIRKGEKGSLIVKYGRWTPKDAQKPEPAFEDDEDNPERLYSKAAYVFNAAQVDGFTPPDIAPRADLTERLEHVENFVANTRAEISYGGYRAFYRHPPADIIVLPERSFFEPTATSTATEAFYSTVLHECSHWTGAKHRLDREHGKRFGDEAYAFEELVAEITSGILCAELGISSSLREDHVQYIAHWLGILKGDKKAIFAAASHATRASDFLFSLQPDGSSRNIDSDDDPRDDAGDAAVKPLPTSSFSTAISDAAALWKRYLEMDRASSWAERAKRALKFCEMQMAVS